MVEWRTAALSGIAAGVLVCAVLLATWREGDATTVVVEAVPTQTVCELARAELLAHAAQQVDSNEDEEWYWGFVERQEC
jgi:hypothetical protein